jgi:hypothetical protein
MEFVDKIAKVTTIRRMGFSDVPEFPVRLKTAEILPLDGSEQK